MIKSLRIKSKHLWATAGTTFLWNSQLLNTLKIKRRRDAREFELLWSECVGNRSSFKMIIIKTSFSLDCQPHLTPLLRSCSCGWRCSSYTVFSGAQSDASSYISAGSCFYICLFSIFAPEHSRLSLISTVTKYVRSVTKIHNSLLTSWHHDTVRTLAHTTFLHIKKCSRTHRKLRSSGALTCSCPLDEKRGLRTHRTLFEHLHHPSMTGCSHRLLVHLQDQVSLYEASGCLRARLQHLANNSSSNKLTDMLFSSSWNKRAAHWHLSAVFVNHCTTTH